MIVLMFKPQFAQLVATGTKLQTVRPVRKRPIKVGTPVSLREWSGLPYRSKQNVLFESTITAVCPVRIAEGSITINGCTFFEGSFGVNAFARLDGFNDWPAMRDWFDKTHGLPFEGIVINWAP